MSSVGCCDFCVKAYGREAPRGQCFGANRHTFHRQVLAIKSMPILAPSNRSDGCAVGEDLRVFHLPLY